MTLTVIILTKNEERHVQRAIDSVKPIADSIVVVDSGSTDGTVEIANESGAVILENPWINHSVQFNWALDQLPAGTDWVLRLDADEYLQPSLAREIGCRLDELGSEIEGIFLGRRMTFLGREIRHGGLFPLWVLRLFRHGKGRCEDRWMDEHIVVAGETVKFERGELIDDNLNSVTWWTQKHNEYASREALELLNLEYGFLRYETLPRAKNGGQATTKKWLKERFYARMPAGIRAMLYFLYRYGLRLGFLDGREGLAFHFLQGFWYRYLVDVKLREVHNYMACNDSDVVLAIQVVLNIDVGYKKNKAGP